jgi:hypothetical protein
MNLMTDDDPMSAAAKASEPGLADDSAHREQLDRACRAGQAAAGRLVSGAAIDVRSCPIRVEFIRRLAQDKRWWAPPMMHMLRGGRGGEVRLKLYLSMLWIAAKPRDGVHATEFAAYSWANLLGLDDPDTTGKRRIQDAIAWLDAESYVTRRSRPGRPPIVELRHDDGTGDPYASPIARGKTGEPKYRKLPPSMWTKGWIAELSGAALVVWLAYSDERSQSSDPKWLTPKQTSERYGISVDTRKKGLAELRGHGLVTPYRRWRRPDFERPQATVQYRLNLSRLDERPDQG